MINEALEYYGLSETHGEGSNPTILEWIKKISFWVEDDSKYSWCGVFMGVLFDRMGWTDAIPEGHQAAKRWRNVGKHVLREEAKPGDIVIFHRTDSKDWRGHVGLYVNLDKSDPNYINVLGGNQDNRVCIKRYAKSKLFTVRRMNNTIYYENLIS